MSDFKTSLDEYTKEEIEENGNQVYGGKRHDEICDYLQKAFNFSEEQITDISMGVWKGIESEKMVSQQKLDQKDIRIKGIEKENEKLRNKLIEVSKHLNSFYSDSDFKGGAPYELSSDDAYYYIGFTRDLIDMFLRENKITQEVLSGEMTYSTVEFIRD